MDLANSRDAFSTLMQQGADQAVAINPAKVGRAKKTETPQPEQKHAALASDPLPEIVPFPTPPSYADAMALIRERQREHYFPSAEQSKKLITDAEAHAKETAVAHAPTARHHDLLVAEADAAEKQLAAIDVRLDSIDAEIADLEESQVIAARAHKPLDELVKRVAKLRTERQPLDDQRNAYATVARETADAVQAHQPKFSASLLKRDVAQLAVERAKAKHEMTKILEPAARKLEEMIKATRAREAEVLAPLTGSRDYDRVRLSLARDDLGAHFAAAMAVLLQ